MLGGVITNNRKSNYLVGNVNRLVEFEIELIKVLVQNNVILVINE